MSEQEVYPLAVLIDELKHDDVPTRVTAMQRLPTVALALGDERTRTELIPFLNDVAKEDEDEILTLLAEQLGDFIELIGGPEYAHLLLEPLATLAVCEEPVVRDTAIQSLISVSRIMPPAQILSHFVNLVRKLSVSEWFSSRIAAAGLYPATFEALSKQRSAELPAKVANDLLSSFSELVSDDAPMVRRAVGNNFPVVINSLSPQSDLEKLLPMFLTLSRDPQDSVKLLAMDVAIALAKLNPEVFVPPLIPHVYNLLDDKSWRVRYQAADRFAALSNSIALNVEEGKNSHEKLLELFVNLANDPEAEVRTAISKQVVDYTKDLLDVDEIIKRIVPCLENLTSDPSVGVREALAGKIAHMSPQIGKEHTVTYLLPLFLDMLRDEQSEVRLQIISNLDVINEIIGIDRLSESLLPAISDLAKDKQWRVLLAVIDYSPLLAKQLGVDFFNKELVPLVINWLWDPVWAIRDAAAENLKTLADVFGIDWLEQEILPKLVGLQANANYLYRFTALLAVKKIASTLTVNTLVTSVLPFITDMSEDPVANVRFNCATTFAKVANRIAGEKTETIQTEILPVLERLTEDNDTDVRFFATEALKSIRDTHPEAFE